MEFRPILSTLMRHKIAALLIVLEIALTCAIVCNALFLIGERDWQDYEVTAEVTLHGVSAATGPASGGNGLGLMLRFAGHSVGGAKRFPLAQPKWGYQPFGAIAWLRWQRGEPDGPAVRQFFGGGGAEVDHAALALQPGERYVLKARAETLPDDEGRGVTRYSFKVWPAAAAEPRQRVARQGGTLLRGFSAIIPPGQSAVRPRIRARTRARAASGLGRRFGPWR